jgi:hypothetical protein
MTSHLIEIVRTLNQAGIVPLLMKGCVSLWIDQTPWRHMRDIDVMVEPAQLRSAQQVLRNLGFRDLPADEGGKAAHHLLPMVRDGMPASLEVHEKLSNSRVERYLPTDSLVPASIDANKHGCRAKILPAPHTALHGLAHHQFGHRSSSFGTLNLKGLHEFAWAIAAMEIDERDQLRALARKSRRLRAALKLWAAAAAEFYKLSLSPDWQISANASKQAQAALRRTATGVHESLLATFMREAFQSTEDASIDGEIAPTWAERLRRRLVTVKDAGRDIVVPWRNRNHLRKTSAGIRE